MRSEREHDGLVTLIRSIARAPFIVHLCESSGIGVFSLQEYYESQSNQHSSAETGSFGYTSRNIIRSQDIPSTIPRRDRKV